jgi:hypothetical protein
MTREELLAWEANQELRDEFDGFAPIAMTGGTVAHSAIEHNLHISIGGRLPVRSTARRTANTAIHSRPRGGSARRWAWKRCDSVILSLRGPG